MHAVQELWCLADKHKNCSSIRNIIHLGWLLFLRDFRYRFRLTYLGYAWAFVRPVFMVLPFILVGRQFNFGESIGDEVSYEVFAFVGFLLWMVIWDSIVIPQWFIRRVRRIVKSVLFQYMAVIVAACFYILFYLCIYLIEIFLILVLFGVDLTWSQLAGVIIFPLLMIPGLCVGIMIAPISFIYLDFRYSLPAVAGIILWTAPVLYVAPKDGILYVLNTFNPVTYLVNVPRSWFIGADTAGLIGFSACMVAAVFLLILSIKFYLRAVPIAKEEIL